MQPEASHASAASARPAAQAEADHRIANNLALLNGVILYRARELERHPGPLEPRHVGEVLRDLSHRIEAIGKLHMLLSAKGDGAVGLVQLVGEICTHVTGILPPGRVSLSMDCGCQAMIEAGEAMHVGRILAEMLTNAVKYAHPSGIPVIIHVTCRDVGDHGIMVEIADDGVGLPEGFDPDIDGGIGFKVMRSTAQQLGGSVSFEQTGMGLRSRLHIPRRDGAAGSNVLSFPAPTALAERS
jgi:two-component sensor histidine kinase